MVQVDGILDHLSGLANKLKLANLQPQIVACRNQLHARDGIDVAVFGRFKAGKSSFLNHLAGRAVLPIGVLPLTAIVTRLRHGPVERAAVRFLDGTTKSIPLDDIGRYVGENENPRNTKQVASVEVELPAFQSFAPLEFVDTPGLGSAFTHNTEATLHWLPNVGAALVAVSADAPLSERDLDLLRSTSAPHAQNRVAAHKSRFADGVATSRSAGVSAPPTGRTLGRRRPAGVFLFHQT